MDDVPAIVAHLRNQRLIMDYTFMSAIALFIYDYALTLLPEIKFIWLSPWTYTKVLFLLIRCMASVDMFLFIISQIFLNISVETCRVVYPVATWLMILQLFFSEAILSIRTWAIWYGNKAVGIGLAIITLTHLVSQCILTTSFVHSLQFSPFPFPGYRGCYITQAANTLWKNYTVAIVVKAGNRYAFPLFVLTPIVVSAAQSYRQGTIGVLSRVIHRDGILSYIYIICLSVGNLVTTINLPINMMPLLIPLFNALYALLTVRVVLNIRLVSSRGVESELHTGYIDSIRFAMPTLHSPRYELRSSHNSSRDLEVNIEMTPPALHRMASYSPVRVHGLPVEGRPGISSGILERRTSIVR